MIELDIQHSLGDLAMQEATYPCTHCGSDETECRGYYSDDLICTVYFFCFDCRKEFTHIMGMEIELWRKIKIKKEMRKQQ